MVGLLLGLLAGCGGDASAPTTGTLAFTDANVSPISGGYVDGALAVDPTRDLCVDASTFGSTLGSINVWQLGLSEGAARCVLGREGLRQSDVLGMFNVVSPPGGRACISEMRAYATWDASACAPDVTWVVSVTDTTETTVAFKLLDPCAVGGASSVSLDDTPPVIEPVTVATEEAAVLTAHEGVQYTLDWSRLTTDGLGQAVVASELFRILLVPVALDASLDDAALDPDPTGGAELWVEEAGATSLYLGTSGGGERFAGFTSDRQWLVAFSPPDACLTSSLVSPVLVAD